MHAAPAPQVAVVGDVHVQGGRQRKGAHALGEIHVKRLGPWVVSPYVVEHADLAGIVTAPVGIGPSKFLFAAADRLKLLVAEVVPLGFRKFDYILGGLACQSLGLLFLSQIVELYLGFSFRMLRVAARLRALQIILYVGHQMLEGHASRGRAYARVPREKRPMALRSTSAVSPRSPGSSHASRPTSRAPIVAAPLPIRTLARYPAAAQAHAPAGPYTSAISCRRAGPRSRRLELRPDIHPRCRPAPPSART